MKFEASFIQGSKGQLFYLERYNDEHNADVNYVVLALMPFAEEANKCRHMLSKLAEIIASDHGLLALYDHYGTGDSEGLFENTSMTLWVDDVDVVLRHIQNRFEAPAGLLAIRSAAMLPFLLLNRGSANFKWLSLINPVLDGRQFIQQFLRLKLASEMTAAEGKKVTMQELKAVLAEEGALEIAGYNLSQEMYEGFIRFDLVKSVSELAGMILPEVDWFELSTRPRDSLLPATVKSVEILEAAGFRVEVKSCIGDQFWATQEITIADSLIKPVSESIRRKLT